MSPVDEQQPPTDQPGPGESQADFDRRVHGAAAGDAGPFDQQGDAPKPTADELRAQLAEAEAAERDQHGAAGAAALGRPPGPPAGTAAQALGASGAQLPADLAKAPAGSLGTGPLEVADRMEVTHTEPVLAQGATGPAVVRLVKLLAHAGYSSNSIAHGENAANVLDRSVMADVERFWGDHPDAREPDELFAGRDGAIHELRGTWVGPYTWQSLYDLAGAGA